MTASCAAMTAARLASITSSQSVRKESGSSATPSRDNSSYTTTLRTLNTSGWLTRCCVDRSRSQNSSVARPRPELHAAVSPAAAVQFADAASLMFACLGPHRLRLARLGGAGRALLGPVEGVVAGVVLGQGGGGGAGGGDVAELSEL